jgi:hypothetical protein
MGQQTEQEAIQARMHHKFTSSTKASKPCEYDGVTYKCAKDVARKLRLHDHQIIYYHIKKGHYQGKPLAYVKKKTEQAC